MTKVQLAPGDAGAPAGRPEDSEANLPQMAMSAPGPSEMQQHFMSAEDQAEAKFQKVRDGVAKMNVTRTEIDKLLAMKDTVTMDAVIDAFGDIVAAGVPAVSAASALAEAPAQQAGLEGWVREFSEKIKPAEAQLSAAMKEARYNLGFTALHSLMAHSAQDHFVREKLRRSTPMGRA